MRRTDLILAFASALAIHIGVFWLPGFSTQAQVEFASGKSALALTIVPSVASVEMRQAPKHIEPPKPQTPPPNPTTPPHIAVPSLPTPSAAPKIVRFSSDLAIAQLVSDVPPLFTLPDQPQDTKDMDKSPCSDVEHATARVEEEEQDTNPKAPPAPAPPETPIPPPAPEPAPHNAPASTESPGDLRDKGVEQKAARLGLSKPKYPHCCRRRGREGTVVLDVTILANGECGDIEVLQSGGCPRMDEAAIEAVRQAEFIPAQALGMPVTSKKKLKFVFRLTDE